MPRQDTSTQGSTIPQPQQRDHGAGMPHDTRRAEYKVRHYHPEPKPPFPGLFGHARGRGQRRADPGAAEQRAGPPGAAAHPGVLSLSC